MKSLLTRAAALIVIVAVATLATNQVFASPFGYSADSLFASLESSYYLTKSNFDNTGNLYSLPYNSQFSEYRFNLNAAYDFNDWLEAYATLGFKRTESINNDPALGTITKINTNFSDSLVGANFLLWSGFVSVIPDVSVAFPLYPTPAGSDGNVLLGDGAIVATGKIYVTKHFRKVDLSAYGGLAYRTQGLSTLIPYGFIGHGEFRSFFLDLAVQGAQSINNDQYQYDPIARLSVINLLDAGSFIYDSVNPAWVTATAMLGYRINGSLYVSAGAAQDLWGENASQGTRYLVSIGFNTSTAASAGSEAVPVDDNSKGFEVDTQSEDKSIPPADSGNDGKKPAIIPPVH